MIQLIEILRWWPMAVYGLGMWFIYSGVRDWLLTTYNITYASSIGLGLIIILTLFAFFKFRGAMFRM